MDRIWRKRAVRYIGEIKPQIVADIATGTGDFAMEILKINPQKIVGIDLSEDMLKYARIKAQEKGFNDVIQYVKGDSEKLLFDTDTFDAMTVGFGVRNYQDLEQGLKEMNRVLKHNGRLVILEVSKPTNFFVKIFFNFYFHYVCPFIGRLFSKDSRAYTYLPESVAAFPSGQKFTSILEKTGFKNVTWKPLTFGICAMYTAEK
jgi:demethylmenaquinone methyltransferase/2-methoxy-6-polyprenyl-1,4-benzoquinol methylase